ncbi:MAG TPA: hypothetical protein PLC19_07410 [Marmoricola sp.]|nr:hypothetical protein [Marmoricola sp.]
MDTESAVDPEPRAEPIQAAMAPVATSSAAMVDWLSDDLPGESESAKEEPGQPTEVGASRTTPPSTAADLVPAEPEQPEPPEPTPDATMALPISTPSEIEATEKSESTSLPEPSPEAVVADPEPKPKRGLFRRRRKEQEASEAGSDDSMRAWLEANTATPPDPDAAQIATPPAAPGQSKPTEPRSEETPASVLPEVTMPPEVTPPPEVTLPPEVKSPPSATADPKPVGDTFGVPTFSGGRHAIPKPPESDSTSEPRPNTTDPFTDAPSRVTPAPAHASVVPDPEEKPEQVAKAPEVAEPETPKAPAPMVTPKAPPVGEGLQKAPEYVAYRQASTARSILVSGCVIAGVGVAGGIAWQVLTPGQRPLLVLMIACGLLLLCLIGLLVVRPGILSINDGLIEVSKGKQISHLDLNSTDLEVEANPDPEAKDWSVRLRGSGKELSVDRSQVDVAEFLQILDYYQARVRN